MTGGSRFIENNNQGQIGNTPASLTPDFLTLDNGTYVANTLANNTNNMAAKAKGSRSMPAVWTIDTTFNSIVYTSPGFVAGTAGGSLTKIGGFGVTFSGTNTYNGDTYISAGAIVLSGAAVPVSNGTGTIHFAGGNLTTTTLGRTGAITNPLDVTADSAITTIGTSAVGTVANLEFTTSTVSRGRGNNSPLFPQRRDIWQRPLHAQVRRYFRLQRHDRNREWHRISDNGASVL